MPCIALIIEFLYTLHLIPGSAKDSLTDDTKSLKKQFKTRYDIYVFYFHFDLKIFSEKY